MTVSEETTAGRRGHASTSAPPGAARTPRLSRRTGRMLVASGLAVASATGGIFVAQTASAAPPVFPNNVVVFPDRDFVSIEGYQDHVGETATVTVTRNGQTVGQAKSVVAQGDVAFEINHPGGVCWGVPGLQVTPDIKAGDKVTISFPDGTSEDTTVSSGVASDAVQNGLTVTVSGTLGPDVNRAQIEQRIINPDLVDTAVAKRDVRALPGPLTPAPKGGYSSGLDIAADGSYVATYVFDTQEAADLAANAPLGERLMSWQVEDADANRQGLTIAEFGELGGPGFGGCPAGPGDAAPPAGSATVLVSDDKRSAQVTWTEAVSVPDAPVVTGYSVLAIADEKAGTTAQQATNGSRFNETARSTTITGLDPVKTYTFEVRSLTADNRASAPFSVGTGGGTQVPGAPAQLTVSPAPGPNGSVVAASSVSASTTAGSQIWYAFDAAVYAGGVLTDAAKPYTGPIPVTAQVEIHFAALNSDNNVETVTGTYAPSVAPLDTPTGLTATPGQGQVQLRWNASTDATSYQVRVYRASDGTEITPAPATTTSLGQLITGLTAGQQYQFTVTALATGRTSPESAQTAAVTVAAVTDRVSVTRAQWKAGDFRVVGSAGAGNTVTVYRVNADGTRGAAIPGATGAVDALGAFDLRLRTPAAPATNPGRIIVGSSGGGFSPVTTVTNG